MNPDSQIEVLSKRDQELEQEQKRSDVMALIKGDDVTEKMAKIQSFENNLALMLLIAKYEPLTVCRSSEKFKKDVLRKNEEFVRALYYLNSETFSFLDAEIKNTIIAELQSPQSYQKVKEYLNKLSSKNVSDLTTGLANELEEFDDKKGSVFNQNKERLIKALTSKSHFHQGSLKSILFVVGSLPEEYRNDSKIMLTAINRVKARARAFKSIGPELIDNQDFLKQALKQNPEITAYFTDAQRALVSNNSIQEAVASAPPTVGELWDQVRNIHNQPFPAKQQTLAASPSNEQLSVVSAQRAQHPIFARQLVPSTPLTISEKFARVQNYYNKPELLTSVASPQQEVGPVHTYSDFIERLNAAVLENNKEKLISLLSDPSFYANRNDSISLIKKAKQLKFYEVLELLINKTPRVGCAHLMSGAKDGDNLSFIDVTLTSLISSDNKDMPQYLAEVLHEILSSLMKDTINDKELTFDEVAGRIISVYEFNKQIAPAIDLLIQDVIDNSNVIFLEVILEKIVPEHCHTKLLPFLHYAIDNGKIEIARLFLDLYPSFINDTNEEGQTALELAVSNSNLEAVKLLCGYGAKVGAKHKNNALLSALNGEDESHKKIASFLVQHSPPPITWLTRIENSVYKTNSLVTRVLLNDNLSDSQIENLPLHITSMVYTKNVPVECLRALEEKGIKLISPPTTLLMDGKYLGAPIPEEGKSSKSAEETFISAHGIYESNSKVVVALPKLKTFKGSGELDHSVVPSLQNQSDPYQFIASLKGPISSTDKVFTVFGYRQNNACLPIVSDNGCRCIVVLTVEEYNNLNIPQNSDLAKHYDFLILNQRKKINSEEAVKVSMLTERRRAAFSFARSHALKRIAFMDDNITEIAITDDLTDTKGTEKLYNYLSNKMDKTKEPLLSIATYSRLHRTLRKNQLGCKVWIEDIQKISKALPEECYEALMPYNEFRWGEDYYLQVLLSTLFADEQTNVVGSRILPPEEIQLKRLCSQKSANAKGGMRAKEYTPDDVLHSSIRDILKEKYPLILDNIDTARFTFNSLVRPHIEGYEAKKELCSTLDLDEIRRKNLELKKCSLIKMALVEQTSSSDTPLSQVSKAVSNNEFGTENSVILYADKLFYANKDPQHVYEIVTTNRNKRQYKSLKGKISAKDLPHADASSDEIGLISFLTGPTHSNVKLKGDFIENLHAILKESVSDEGFSVTSQGKTVELRKYQNEAIEWIANHIAQTDYKDFTFNMATGTGKTVLMLIIALAASSANPDKNVMIVFPSIQLVRQTLKKVFSDFKPLLDYFNVPQEKVYGVCSEKPSASDPNEIITAAHVAQCKKVRDSGHFYLFCAASLKTFNKFDGLEIGDVDKRKAFMDNVSAVILDESHKQEKLEQSEALALAKEALSFKFSATPIKVNAQDCPDNEFQYLRPRAIEEGFLTPLLVDKTLPKDCDNEDMLNCLLHHKHPNGGTLKDHKGIIYVPYIKGSTPTQVATELAKALQDSRQFEEGFVHVIHSGNKDGVDTECKDNNIALDNFKKRKTGIAIVVRQLVEGYDDDDVDYVIVNRKEKSAKNIHQEVGRTLRLNKKNPSKVGYAILREGNQENDALEESCYPEALKQQQEQHETLVGNIRDTILQKRSPERLSVDVSDDTEKRSESGSCSSKPPSGRSLKSRQKSLKQTRKRKDRDDSGDEFIPQSASSKRATRDVASFSPVASHEKVLSSPRGLRKRNRVVEDCSDESDISEKEMSPQAQEVVTQSHNRIAKKRSPANLVDAPFVNGQGFLARAIPCKRGREPAPADGAGASGERAKLVRPSSPFRMGAARLLSSSSSVFQASRQTLVYNHKQELEEGEEYEGPSV